MSLSLHPANRIHPAYVRQAKQRELSLAYREGTEVFKLDGSSRGKKLWVKPEPGETSNDALQWYAARVDRWTSSNVYADSLRVSGVVPFRHRILCKGWPKTLEERIDGKGGGLDGQGLNLRMIHRQIYLEKLFAGIHFQRAVVVGGRVIWKHESADALVFWQLDHVDQGLTLTAATVEDVTPDGYVMRRLFSLEEGRRVRFREFISNKRADERYRIYAPTNEEEMILDFPQKPQNEGEYVVSAIPLVAYATSWRHPFQSPAPFSDAASLQLEVDRQVALLNDYSARQSLSALFVITGLGLDSNGKVSAPTVGGNSVRLEKSESDAKWEAIDTQHVPQQMQDVERKERLIRNKCMNASGAMPSFVETKEAQIRAEDEKAMTWLELCMQADMVSSRSLLLLTAEMEGLRIEGEPTLTASEVMTRQEKRDLLVNLARWTQDRGGNLFSGGEFREAFRQHSGLTQEEWEALTECKDGDDWKRRIKPDLWFNSLADDERKPLLRELGIQLEGLPSDNRQEKQT